MGHLASGEVAAKVIFIARVVIGEGLFPLLKTLSAVKITFQAQMIQRKQKLLDYEWSPIFLRDSRASVKITPREKRRHAAGREKNEGLQTKPKLLNLCIALTTQNSDWLFHGNCQHLSKTRQPLSPLDIALDSI